VGVKFVGFSNSDVPRADVLSSSIQAPIQPVGRYCIATGEMKLKEIYSCREIQLQGDTAAGRYSCKRNTATGGYNSRRDTAAGRYS
jgi:hypothetical protein